MTDYIGGRVTAFAGQPVTKPRKAQRYKLLEEAAEAFAAAQGMEPYEDVDFDGDTDLRGCMVYDLANELADVIQCVVNLAAIHGISPDELDAAMERCRERNRERGRV